MDDGKGKKDVYLKCIIYFFFLNILKYKIDYFII